MNTETLTAEEAKEIADYIDVSTQKQSEIKVAQMAEEKNITYDQAFKAASRAYHIHYFSQQTRPAEYMEHTANCR